MQADNVYVALAKALGARLRCIENLEQDGLKSVLGGLTGMGKSTFLINAALKARDNAQKWVDRHEQTIKEIEELLPSGAGFDNGSQVDLARSTGEKIVIQTAYHHMDEGGCYDGWTDHMITLRPSFELGFSIRIGGRDRNGIKEYIAEVFGEVLGKEWQGPKFKEEVSF